MVYLDNAATTWPKPEEVYRATDRALRNAANPGRGGHRFSRISAGLVLESREIVARFFGVQDSRQIIFTSGATDSLNAIIQGLMPRVRKVLSAGFEHNSLWRPLEHLSHQGVEVTYVDCMGSQGFDWAAYKSALAAKPDLITITHGSNITGQLFPLEDMVKLGKDAGSLVCVDISQTAGIVPLDFEALKLDFAAFPGHKGLLGPPGIGGFYISPDLTLIPLRLGGTGGNSADAQAPELLPERYESGTLNTPGIAGLAAGVSYLEQRGLASVLEHELGLRSQAITGLKQLGATVFGVRGPAVGVLSFNLSGLDSAELAYILDDVYDISVRGGLHCCPQGHKSLGTLGPGTVRISPGLFNTGQDIEKLLDAVEQVSRMTR